MKKIVLALSGGMDSSTLLAYLLDKGFEVIPVTFEYGSKHNRYEYSACLQIARHYNLKIAQCFDLTNIMSQFKSNLLKSGGDIPEGHYTDVSMNKTVVPGRNIIFLSILSGFAWSVEASQIAIGIHKGDHAIYPDCRPQFYTAMKATIQYGTGGMIELIAPFLNHDKTQILKAGLKLEVPYELTRTCYKEQWQACGKCGSCNERIGAFKNNGVLDPIKYAK